MKVLLDVNVILDVLLQRPEWLADAQAVWDAADGAQLHSCLAASSLTDIFYIARKLVGEGPARTIVRDCLDTLDILGVDEKALEEAYARPETDYEDALQIAIATLNSVDAIVTRDAVGFAESPVPVWTPAQLAEHLRSTMPGP